MTRKFAPYTKDLSEKQVTESTTSPANRRRTNISFLNEKIVHCFLKQRFFPVFVLLHRRDIRS